MRNREPPLCMSCELIRTQISRLLDVLVFIRESSFREADGYLTIEPDAVDELIQTESEVREALGYEKSEYLWPGETDE